VEKGIKSLASLVSINKSVLQFLDILEVFRDLSVMEWNFRILVPRILIFFSSFIIIIGSKEVK
jgi:hypothetical protein